MNFKPLFNNVLVEPLEAEQKTASGIYIPETAQEKSKRGRVLAVGDGKYEDGKLVIPSVKVGEVVFWSYGGEEIKIDGKKLLVIEEARILGIIN
jgi:chaperonin GroES